MAVVANVRNLSRWHRDDHAAQSAKQSEASFLPYGLLGSTRVYSALLQDSVERTVLVTDLD
jgi:hypothetical protein